MSKQEALNQPIPEGTKFRMIFETPTNRGEWANGIYSTISAIEASTCNWDAHSITVLDDAYDYCEAYGYPEIKQKVKDTRSKFLENKSIVVEMNNLRSFFHDQSINPSIDSVSCLEKYQLIDKKKEWC